MSASGGFFARNADFEWAGNFHDLALAAAGLRRLESAAGVELAVRQARHLVLAAEVEVGHLRVADRPAAAALDQRLNGFALGKRDDDLLDRWYVGFRLRLIEGAEAGLPVAENRALAMRFDAMRGRARWLFMREVVARPDRPSRWTLPITALRVTLPSRPAIWLALKPSPHSFFSSSTRSSVQAIKFRSLSIRGAR